MHTGNAIRNRIAVGIVLALLFVLSTAFANAESLANGLRSTVSDTTYVVGSPDGIANPLDGDFPFSTTTDSNGVAHWVNTSWTNNNSVYFRPQTTTLDLNGSSNSSYKFWMFFTRSGAADDNRFRSSAGSSNIGSVGGNFSVAGNTIHRVSWANAFGSSASASEFHVGTLRCAAPTCRIYLMKWTTEDLSYIDTQAELYDYMDVAAKTEDVTGNISTTTTWVEDRIYKVRGGVYINSGVTLTIQPGAVVKFMTATSSLVVNGTLIAEGEDEHFGSRIYLTSYKDDQIAGDTNLDATSTSPAAGDWGGIRVNSGGTASIAYALIRYGSNASTTNAMINNSGGTLNISTSTVVYSSNYGVSTAAGTTTILASDIAYNNSGLNLSGGKMTIAATSTIHNNTVYGAVNSTTATSSFIAENNYWTTATSSASTGPYHPTLNPSGTGNEVSSYIDFDPWIGKAGTPTPHYVTRETLPVCISLGYCTSVPDGSTMLVLDASTTPYIAETNAATSTWHEKGGVNIVAATSSYSNAAIYAYSNPDDWTKGAWNPVDNTPHAIYLNTYYLDQSSSAGKQNTITHELGHALGLDHSYTGNVMFISQSSQTTLGDQDLADYFYLW